MPPSEITKYIDRRPAIHDPTFREESRHLEHQQRQWHSYIGGHDVYERRISEGDVTFGIARLYNKAHQIRSRIVGHGPCSDLPIHLYLIFRSRDDVRLATLYSLAMFRPLLLSSRNVGSVLDLCYASLVIAIRIAGQR